MKLRIDYTQEDVESIRRLVNQQESHAIVQRRINTRPDRPHTPRLWRAHLSCLLTTQNKSGQGSPVDVFMSQRPFPLSLEAIRANPAQAERLIWRTLENANPGLRRWKTIAESAAANLGLLEAGGWQKLKEFRDRLWEQMQQEPAPNHHRLEREAAQHMNVTYKGFGPKQSRNFWQSVGLARFEIPIDSRVLRWSQANLSLRVPTQGLADETFYQLVVEAFQALCAEAGVLPSVFDGAVFASFEKDAQSTSTAVIDTEELGEDD